MKPILILKTGELPRRVIERAGSYAEAFHGILGTVRCTVIDGQTEELPEPDWAGVIVTGSAASANDGDGWISRTTEFLRRVADRAIPIYGVCFGHQLVARTFGGKVEKCPRGWELGTTSITLTSEGGDDALFSALPESFPAHQSHGEVVTRLPPGAVTLAYNDHWAVQAFRLGDRIWGTQFHPEFTPAIMEGLVASLAAALPPGSFPGWRSEDTSLSEWLSATIRGAPAAARCLNNFATIVDSQGRK